MNRDLNDEEKSTQEGIREGCFWQGKQHARSFWGEKQEPAVFLEQGGVQYGSRVIWEEESDIRQSRAGSWGPCWSAKKVDVFLSVVVWQIKDDHIFLDMLPMEGWHLCPLPWNLGNSLTPWARWHDRSHDTSFQALASSKGQLLFLVLKHSLGVLSYYVRCRMTWDCHAGVVTCRHFSQQSHLNSALQPSPSKHQKI